MASSILVRAKNTIERAKQATIRRARENQKTTALIASGVASTGITVLAAVADQKLGAGNQWKMGPVPVVGAVGAATLVPAFFLGKAPVAQAACVSAGMTGINLSLYRWLVEEGIEPGTS